MAYKRKDAGGGSREAFGNFVIQSQYMHRVYTPKSSDPGKTTDIRVLCSVDPTDGAFMPQVAAVDGDPLEGISDAFHATEFVNFLGTKKYQMVTETTDFEDKLESPTRMFYNNIKKFVEEEGKKREPEWAEWIEWGGAAQLPAYVMMMQGVLIKHNGDICKDKQGRQVQIAPVVLVLNRSATTAMEDALTKPVDETQPISADNSVLGDITSPANGHVLVVDSLINAEGRKRYTVSRGDLCPLDEAYIKATYVPWDKLLKRETASWQIHRLIETFDARSVDMALGDDPDYGPLLPPTAKGAFSGKTIATPAAILPTSMSVTPTPVMAPQPPMTQAMPVAPVAPAIQDAPVAQAMTDAAVSYSPTEQAPYVAPPTPPTMRLNIMDPEQLDLSPEGMRETPAPAQTPATAKSDIMKALEAEKAAALARENATK